MTSFDAAQDISLDKYASWTDAERIAVTVAAIYRELSGDSSHPNVISLLGEMAALLGK